MNNTNDTAIETVSTSTIVTSVIWSLIAIIGIMGNGLVLYIMVKYGDRKPTTLYIINLAITDLAFTVIVIPFNIFSNLFTNWVFGEFFCKFYTYMTYVSVHATCLTLTAMTVDRYFSIVHPVGSMRLRTKMSVMITMIIIWLVSCLMSVPALVFHKVAVNPHGHRDCEIDLPSAGWRIGIAVYCFTAIYLIPLTIVILCYCLILISTFRRTNRSFVQNRNTNMTNSEHAPSIERQIKKRKRLHKLAKMVALIVSLFAVCWLPIHSFNLWFMLAFDDEIPPKSTLNMHIFRTFALTLTFANSCLNPFVYACMGEGFRRAVRLFFPAFSRARRRQNSFTQNLASQPTAMVSRSAAPNSFIVGNCNNCDNNKYDAIPLTDI